MNTNENLPMNELEQLRAENEALKRREAALRDVADLAYEAFKALRDVSAPNGEEWMFYTKTLMDIDDAVAPDASRDLFTREQVMPFVEALKTFESDSYSRADYLRAHNALLHARAIGLLPTESFNTTA